MLFSAFSLQSFNTIRPVFLLPTSASNTLALRCRSTFRVLARADQGIGDALQILEHRHLASTRTCDIQRRSSMSSRNLHIQRFGDGFRFFHGSHANGAQGWLGRDVIECRFGERTDPIASRHCPRVSARRSSVWHRGWAHRNLRRRALLPVTTTRSERTTKKSPMMKRLNSWMFDDTWR